MIHRLDSIVARRGPEILIAKHMDAQLDNPKVGIAGYVKWELVRGGKVIKDSGGFHPNVITNTGMDQIAAQTIDICTTNAGVGTGSNAPAFADVGLQAIAGTMVGRSSFPANAYVAGPPDYWYRQSQYKFLEANANGNLTEFATFSSVVGNPIFSRQLLKDNLGNPTVVTKTNTDQLWITYELRCYVPTVDVATVVTISGVNYDVTTRPLLANQAAAWGTLLSRGVTGANANRVSVKEANALIARTSTDFPTSSNTVIASTAYVSGNYYLEDKQEWGIGVANFPTGIGALASGMGAGGTGTELFQHVFVTTKIPKTNTKKLDLFMRRSWARYP